MENTTNVLMACSDNVYVQIQTCVTSGSDQKFLIIDDSISHEPNVLSRRIDTRCVAELLNYSTNVRSPIMRPCIHELQHHLKSKKSSLARGRQCKNGDLDEARSRRVLIRFEVCLLHRAAETLSCSTSVRTPP